MRSPSPSPSLTHRFVAVVDLGEKADYRSEVRHRVSIALPFRLSKRSGIRQLAAAYQQVFMALQPVMPTFHRRLHVWLLDPETGEPSLFVSGLLGLLQGKLTKQKAERLDSKIRPQITRSQSSRSYRFLLNATAHAWGCPEEFCDEDATDEVREYAVLNGILGGFDHCELTDVDHVDEDCVGVTADLWHSFTLDLPFKPRMDCSETQLGYILGRLEEVVRQESCGDLYDLRMEETDVWLADESAQPREYVSGWIRVKEGSHTAAEMKKLSRQLLERIPAPIRSRAATLPV